MPVHGVPAYDSPLDCLAWPAPRAAYVHVPFCVHRCGYCNFTVAAGRDDLIDAYLEAIERELSWLGEPRQVDTLFLGGGTPTHLPPDRLQRLLNCVRQWFPLAPGYELSVEANPADLDRQRADVLAAAGVTRLSLGVQSFCSEKLHLLERDHNAEQIAASFALALEVVGANGSVSIDLIFGTPKESLDQWRRDLAAAVALRPNHVSTYGLTYERGTSFWNRLQRGTLSRLDEELERSLFAAAIDSLTDAGFDHYEVSNFALPGRRCRHNETYWAADSFFAAGPGAARYVNGCRQTNHRSTSTYIKRVLAGQSPVAESERLSPEDRAREMFVLGLRRIEGVDLELLFRRTGFHLDELAAEPMRKHIDVGLMELHGNRLRLTRDGLFVSDGLWSEYLRC